MRTLEHFSDKNISNINNNRKQVTNELKSNKIKVIVMTSLNENGPEAYISGKDTDGKPIYSGYAIDLFKNIQANWENMGINYNYDIIYADTTQSHEGVVIDVYNGKYDMAVGLFTHTAQRENMVNFCKPILLDGIAVFHHPLQSHITSFLKSLSVIWKPMFIFIILGLILGLVIYYVDPNRRNATFKNDKKFFKRSLMTGIAAMYGEMGFLSENTSPTTKGVILTATCMLIATICVLFTQAQLTTELLSAKSQSVDVKSFYGTNKPILGLSGYSQAKLLQKLGANIKYINGTQDDLVKEYLDNSNDYTGYVLAYSDGFQMTRKHHSLTATTGFNKEYSGYIVNSHKTKLLEHLNEDILLKKESKDLNMVCSKYFKDASEFVNSSTKVDLCSLAN